MWVVAPYASVYVHVVDLFIHAVVIIVIAIFMSAILCTTIVFVGIWLKK